MIHNWDTTLNVTWVCKHCGDVIDGYATNGALLRSLCPALVRQRFEEIERKLSLITNGVPMGTTIQQQENDTP